MSGSAIVTTDESARTTPTATASKTAGARTSRTTLVWCAHWSARLKKWNLQARAGDAPLPSSPTGRARARRLVGRGRSGSSMPPDRPAAAGVARGARVRFVPTRLPARAAACAHGPRADIGDTRTRCLLMVVLSDRSLVVDGSNNLGLLSLVRARRSERQTYGRARSPAADERS